MALNSCAVARMMLSTIGRLYSKLSFEAAIDNGAFISTVVPERSKGDELLFSPYVKMLGIAGNNHRYFDGHTKVPRFLFLFNLKILRIF